MTTPSRQVVVSGMRPTGRLHIGHLHGALANWVRLQEEAECFFFSADWHALTTQYHDPGIIKASEREMFVDFLAAGIDPEKSTLFVQSEVKEHAELFVLLGMITPVGWLERSPSYKEIRENITDRDLALYGFLGYPVLQTADVILYKANARAGGRGPGSPPRAGPRDRPPLQLPLRRGLPRAAAAAHRGAEDPRHRRAQDVQELRQHHRPGRGRRDHSQEDHGRGDRPRRASAARIRATRRCAGSSTCTR